MTWYCTWCGKDHAPDSADYGAAIGHYSQPDPRYALGLCGRTRRVLVTTEAEALEAAHRHGKFAPKPLTEPAKADDLARKAGAR